MDILFEKDRLRKQCTDEKKRVRTFGQERAKVLHRRLDQLRAADSLEVLRMLPGRCHELKGDRRGQLSLDLDGPYRLIFEPAHKPIPRKDDGGMEWSKVAVVRVIGIEDTHE